MEPTTNKYINNNTKTPHTNTPMLETLGDGINVSDVSGRELKYRARLPKAEQFEILKAFIGTVTNAQLASMLQCSINTLCERKREFYESEEYRNYVRDRVHSYLSVSNKNIPDIEKLRALVSIYKAMIEHSGHDIDKDVEENKAKILATLKQYNAFFSSSVKSTVEAKE